MICIRPRVIEKYLISEIGNSRLYLELYFDSSRGIAEYKKVGNDWLPI
jgi:hypothetical protein